VFNPDEAAVLREESHTLAARLAKIEQIGVAWDSVRQADPTKVVLHCHNVQFFSAAFSRMIVDPRLTSIAQSIIGPNVQLHHTKMFIKPPEKGAPFPMHQDYPYFPHENNSMIAAIVHFDDAPIEKGCLRVVPGSHKLGPITPDNPRDHSFSPQRYPISEATPCPAKAGDVLFFSYLTIHGSGVNESKEARTTVLIQMRDPADPPSIALHESRGQGMMLAGLDPTCCRTKARRSADEQPKQDASHSNPMAPSPMAGR
jgi:phytanoyl-CoA hydroxylase